MLKRPMSSSESKDVVADMTHSNANDSGSNLAGITVEPLLAVPKRMLQQPPQQDPMSLPDALASTTPTLTPLPSDSTGFWMQRVDDSGVTIYYNTVTGETSWEKPAELDLPTSSIGTGSDALTPVDENTTPDATATAMPNDPASLPASAPDASDSANASSNDSNNSSKQNETLRLVKKALQGNLKRLERHAQLTLEETRRIHREYERLRDEEVAQGGDLWIEVYDPTHDCFYYYGTKTGQVCWKKPASYVMKLDNDDFLRVVVKLQCAFRMALARREVYRRKFTQRNSTRKTIVTPAPLLTIGELTAKDDVASTSGPSAPGTTSARKNTSRENAPTNGAAESAASPVSEVDHRRATVTDRNKLWVEVFDPYTKLQYYYCSQTQETRWDAPPCFISSIEDKEMAATITIQTFSRAKLARQSLLKRKEELEKLKNEKAALEAKMLREKLRKEFLMKSDDERESICRTELLEEEMQQCRHGDTFWGIDVRTREITRQLVEEKLMRDSEEFWRRVNQTLRMKYELETKKNREEEAKKHKEELVNEQKERLAMNWEEKNQCRSDKFWGCQAQEQQEAANRHQMDQEEQQSWRVQHDTLQQAQEAQWRHEMHETQHQKMRQLLHKEKKYQEKYLQLFYTFTSSDQVLQFVWPTQVVVPATLPQERCPPGSWEHKTFTIDFAAEKQQLHRHHQHAHQHRRHRYHDELPLNPPMRAMDGLRIRPLYTVHSANAAHIQGRQGKLDVQVTDTTSIYELNLKASSPSKASNGPSDSLRYDSQQFPDPNVPARYNGIPPLDETRDILVGAQQKQPIHRLDPLQLASPSRSKYKSHCVPPQLSSNQRLEPSPHGPHRAKGKPNGKPKRSVIDRAIHSHTRSSVADLQEQKLHEDFTRELPILRHLFLLMDTDRSGMIDKKELHWALKRDKEMLELSAFSPLLRVALKRPACFQELFEEDPVLDASRTGGAGSHSSSEISWETFKIFWELKYMEFARQNLLSPSTIKSAGSPEEKTTKKHQRDGQHEPEPSIPAYLRPRVQRNRRPSAGPEIDQAQEEANASQVFTLADLDKNGFVDQEEMRTALQSNKQVRELVLRSKALKPLLEQQTFMEAFMKMETQDPKGMSEDEFIVFCTELASIAVLNNMV